MKTTHLLRCLLFVGLALGTTGCIKSMAVGALGDALAEPGGSFGQDDDPDFICESTPFGLKTIESLLDAEPEHEGLHLAATRGFIQYAYACLQMRADQIEEDDFSGAKHLRRRAQRMYRRAVRYGLRGMSLVLERDAQKAMRSDVNKALAAFDDEHVPLLYWTAMSWAAGVALDKDDIELAADLDLVEALMSRVAALEPNYGEGAVHDFYLSWEMAKPDGKVEVARSHLEQSLALSKNERLSPLVSYAESVLVKQQKGAEFDALMDRVLAFDVDSAPRHRLVNLIAQRRARWLKAHKDDLFL